jgi:hypothetical protein
MSKPEIIMLGPDIKGGVLTVINMLNKSDLISSKIINLVTYRGDNIVIRILSYLDFLVNYIYILATNKHIKLIHIHSASKGSFARKSIALLIGKLFNKKVFIKNT